MERSCRNKYLVLSTDIIKYLYLKNHCSNEVARLLILEPVFDWDIITELDLCRLNVVHILGLRLVTNLKRLNFAQNFIKKIENIEWLIKLEHLDLSFNRITKIENLETLTHIKYLNLNGNRIVDLENLEENIELQTLSIADNEITDMNQFDYLLRFRHLQFMSVENNPVINDESRQMIIDLFPDLLYLNNKQIMKFERRKNSEIFLRMSYANVEDYSDEDRQAFLYQTDGKDFFDQLYKNDMDGVVLSKWNFTVEKAFDTYQKEINKYVAVMRNKCYD